MSNKFKIITFLSLAFAFFVGCNKDDLALADGSTEVTNLMGWMEPEDDKKLSKVYITAESYGFSGHPHSYRVQATIKDKENPERQKAITSINIGDLVIPALDDSQNNSEQLGIAHKVFSPQINEDEWSEFTANLENEVDLIVYDEDGEYDRQAIRIASPLSITIAQDGRPVSLETGLIRSKPLTISWPVPQISFRNGHNYESKVGAAVMYSAPETRRSNAGSLSGFPQNNITKELAVPFDVGSLTFTAADLESFPYKGMVTIYVGNVRYRVDHNGDVVQAPGSSVTVVSGGVSGSPFIRVNER